MYKPDRDRARAFWSALQDCWIKLYGSSFPTAAAINGNSPAGYFYLNRFLKVMKRIIFECLNFRGCLFAMCCEYRVMVPKFTIGLNETQLGIVAPSWFMATMRNTLNPREAEIALTLGIMYKTEEALRIGLIDEIAVDKADAISKCELFLEKFKKIPPVARAITKQNFRKADIEELQKNREADVELFVNAITRPDIQKSLGKYVAFLKWRKRLKPLLDGVKFVTNIFKPKKKN
jgi:3,2-trans-enoyl-CoA isomerase